MPQGAGNEGIIKRFTRLLTLALNIEMKAFDFRKDNYRSWLLSFRPKDTAWYLISCMWMFEKVSLCFIVKDSNLFIWWNSSLTSCIFMMIGLSKRRLSNLTLGFVGIRGAFDATYRLAGVIPFCFFLSSSKQSSFPWSDLASYYIFIGMPCKFPSLPP